MSPEPELAAADPARRRLLLPGPELAPADPARRRLLARALLAGGLLAARPALALADTASPPPSDPDLLTGLLKVEVLMANAYERVLASGRLGPRARRLARRVLAHEHAHAAALTAELTLFGSVPPAPRLTASELDAGLAQHKVATSLESLGSEKDALKFLTQVESAAEAAYFAAMSKFSRPRLLTLGAEILASEAQHFTLVAQLLHPHDLGFNKVVPDAFVQGHK